MPKVFVSYVREDADAVKRIVDVLREFEVQVWLDKDSIKPGLRWTDEIRHGISNGDFFLACFSKAFQDREKSYIHEELTQAIEQLRQRPTNRAWFLPIRLDDCEIPDRSIGAGETLRSIQWIDMHTDSITGTERLLLVLAPGSERIPRLIAELDNESARRRVEAIEALGRLGTLARPAYQKLVDRIPIEADMLAGITPLAAIRDLFLKDRVNLDAVATINNHLAYWERKLLEPERKRKPSSDYTEDENGYSHFWNEMG